ncbi:glycosyltransferase family 2 protein [Pedobacter sp. Leaf250]|uniref:glycosyltransferase family 2 protein n=1 Tax=Pedobacter sp. Leaf250 TaxID=2876559 RepID=UPI001E339701|nr:glycosyltransferase family 2 protein [Pedobacter sp. Leaf250]
MKISIITVVFNNVHTIKTAIESVLCQQYPNIEYIIIDGGSTDGTLEVIQGYHAEIHQVLSEKDKGIYDAMNKGISHCTGEVIGILNSDDVYENSAVIQTVMDAFLDDQELGMVYGDLVYVKNDDLSQVVRKWSSENYYDHFFEDGNVPPHPSLFIKSEVYQKVGVFNLNMRLAADYEFMLRLFKLYRFKSRYINILLVRMRLGGATNVSLKNIINGNLEILSAWKQNHLKVPLSLMPKRILKRLTQFIK